MIKCRITESFGGARKPVSQWTDTDRMEWQANRLSSAILMPSKMIHTVVAANPRDSAWRIATDRFYPENIVTLAAETFQVSKEAAAYRLQELGLIQKRLDLDVLTGARDVKDVFVR